MIPVTAKSEFVFIYLFISFGHTKDIQRYNKQSVKQTKQEDQENRLSVSQLRWFPMTRKKKP